MAADADPSWAWNGEGHRLQPEACHQQPLLQAAAVAEAELRSRVPASSPSPTNEQPRHYKAFLKQLSRHNSFDSNPHAQPGPAPEHRIPSWPPAGPKSAATPPKKARKHSMPSAARVPQDESEDDDPGQAVKSCVECGRTRTPQWREGPLGPKTLCNACGVKRQRVKRMRQQEAERMQQAAASRHDHGQRGPWQMRIQEDYDDDVYSCDERDYDPAAGMIISPSGSKRPVRKAAAKAALRTAQYAANGHWQEERGAALEPAGSLPIDALAAACATMEEDLLKQNAQPTRSRVHPDFAGAVNLINLRQDSAMSNQGWQIPAHRPQHMATDVDQDYLMDPSAAAAAAAAPPPEVWGNEIPRGAAAFSHCLPGQVVTGQHGRMNGCDPQEGPWPTASLRRESGMHPELSVIRGPGDDMHEPQAFSGWEPSLLGIHPSHQLFPAAQLPIYPLTDQTRPSLSQPPLGTLQQWQMEQGLPVFGMPWLDPSGLADLAVLHPGMPQAHPEGQLSRRATFQGTSVQLQQQPQQQQAEQVPEEVDMGYDIPQEGQVSMPPGARHHSDGAGPSRRGQDALRDNLPHQRSTARQTMVPPEAGSLPRTTPDKQDAGPPAIGLQLQAANVAASSHSHSRIHRQPSPRASFTNSATLIRTSMSAGCHAPDLPAGSHAMANTPMLLSSHPHGAALTASMDGMRPGVIRPVAVRLVDQGQPFERQGGMGEHGHMGSMGPGQHAAPRAGGSFSAPQVLAPWQQVRTICAWPPGFAPGHTTGILSRVLPKIRARPSFASSDQAGGQSGAARGAPACSNAPRTSHGQPLAMDATDAAATSKGHPRSHPMRSHSTVSTQSPADPALLHPLPPASQDGGKVSRASGPSHHANPHQQRQEQGALEPSLTVQGHNQRASIRQGMGLSEPMLALSKNLGIDQNEAQQHQRRSPRPPGATMKSGNEQAGSVQRTHGHAAGPQRIQDLSGMDGCQAPGDPEADVEISDDEPMLEAITDAPDRPLCASVPQLGGDIPSPTASPAPARQQPAQQQNAAKVTQLQDGQAHSLHPQVLAEGSGGLEEAEQGSTGQEYSYRLPAATQATGTKHEDGMGMQVHREQQPEALEPFERLKLAAAGFLQGAESIVPRSRPLVRHHQGLQDPQPAAEMLEASPDDEDGGMVIELSDPREASDKGQQHPEGMESGGQMPLHQVLEGSQPALTKQQLLEQVVQASETMLLDAASKDHTHDPLTSQAEGGHATDQGQQLAGPRDAFAPADHANSPPQHDTMPSSERARIGAPDERDRDFAPCSPHHQQEPAASLGSRPISHAAADSHERRAAGAGSHHPVRHPAPRQPPRGSQIQPGSQGTLTSIATECGAQQPATSAGTRHGSANAGEMPMKDEGSMLHQSRASGPGHGQLSPGTGGEPAMTLVSGTVHGADLVGPQHQRPTGYQGHHEGLPPRASRRALQEPASDALVPDQQRFCNGAQDGDMEPAAVGSTQHRLEVEAIALEQAAARLGTASVEEWERNCSPPPGEEEAISALLRARRRAASAERAALAGQAVVEAVTELLGKKQAILVQARHHYQRSLREGPPHAVHACWGSRNGEANLSHSNQGPLKRLRC